MLRIPILIFQFKFVIYSNKIKKENIPPSFSSQFEKAYGNISSMYGFKIYLKLPKLDKIIMFKFTVQKRQVQLKAVSVQFGANQNVNILGEKLSFDQSLQHLIHQILLVSFF